MTGARRAQGDTSADPDVPYDELSRSLRQLARQLVGDAARADDLVQEAWVAALDREPQQVRDLTAWLRQVVRNLASRTYRRGLRRHDAEVLAAASEAVESEARLVERAATYRMLRATTDELEEPYRGVVIARFFEGRSVASIVEETGRSDTTVRRQLERGLELLRRALDRKHHGRRAAWGSALASVLDEPLRPEARPASAAPPTPPTPSIPPTPSALASVPAGVWLVGIAASIPLALWIGMRFLGPPAETPAEALATAERSTPGEATLAPATSPARETAAATSAPATAALDSEPDEASPPPAGTRTLSLTVLTENGAPAFRPEVRIRFADAEELVEGDERGRLELAIPEERLLAMLRSGPDELGVRLHARADGQAWSLAYLIVLPEEGRAVDVFTRGPAWDLHGVVVNEAGDPVAGANVRLDDGDRLTTADSQDGVEITSYVAPRETDAQGRFSWNSIPRRPHRLRLTASGHAPVERLIDAPPSDAPSAGVPEVRRFVLTRGSRVSGQLRVEGGGSAAGARVWISDGMAEERGEPLPSTHCDAEGRYALEGVGAGEHFVFAALADRPEVCATTLLHVRAAGEELSWDDVLSPAEGLTIRVEDAHGVPIGGAIVVLRHEAPPMWGQLRYTGADGIVHFPHVVDGPLGALVSASVQSSRSTSFLCERGRENVLRLPDAEGSACSIRGALTDELGLLERGATVAGTSHGELFAAPVDARSGTYEAGSLEPGTYELLLVVEGLGATPLGAVTVSPGAVAEAPPREVPVPRLVELRWGNERPSAERPWVLAAPLTGSLEERTLLAIEEPVDALELLPGTYRIAPFEPIDSSPPAGNRKHTGARFQVPTDEALTPPPVELP